MADPRLAPTAPKCSDPDPYYRIRNRALRDDCIVDYIDALDSAAHAL